MNSRISAIFFLLFSLGISLSGWSQEIEEEVVEPEKESAWRDKVFFGAGGGLQLSNIATFVSLFPSVGYRITPKWSAGVMGAYQYARFRDFNQSAHNYGASLFTRYIVFRNVFAAAEYEQMNLEYTGVNNERGRRWIDRMLVGAGISQEIPGGRGGVQISVLYDLYFTRNNPNYPYRSPFVYRFNIIF